MERGQPVGFARVALSDYDGEGKLYVFGDNEGMENSLQRESMEQLQPLVRLIAFDLYSTPKLTPAILPCFDACGHFMFLIVCDPPRRKDKR